MIKISKCDYNGCKGEAVETILTQDGLGRPFKIKMCKKCYKEYIKAVTEGDD